MVMDKIERWKILANIFLNESKKVFIKTINGNLHFCNLILIKENSLILKNFGPEQRANKKEEIYWVQISNFEEFKEVIK